MTRTVVPVVLAGGRGTRLWPVSRASLPKALQCYSSLDGDTMLQETLNRLQGLHGFDSPIVVCNDEHVFLVREQLNSANHKDVTIMSEPAPRNTAPALLAAAQWVAREDPDAIIVALPADHVIEAVDRFHQVVRTGLGAAGKGFLVAFGIEPTHPDTEYGYIEMGGAVKDVPDARQIARYREKPDAATATEFLDTGNFVWNSGMFAFPVKELLAEARRHDAELVDGVSSALPTRPEKSGLIKLSTGSFSAVASISIDYALMEKTDLAVVVPCDVGWNDVGNWNALWLQARTDDKSNVEVGDVMTKDCVGSYVRTDGPLVVGLGLKDAVVVATEDAVLVASREQVRNVNGLVDHLAASKRKVAEYHNRVHRPWGFYESLYVGPNTQVKRICLKPGGKLSLQKHRYRAEHWVVVKGRAVVTRDDETMTLAENESIFLPLGCVHRLENHEPSPMVLIEVQFGEYLGEDDIVRLEDVYGPVK